MVICMGKFLKDKKNKPVKCYYDDFGSCSCDFCEHADQDCIGKECRDFISEEEYFQRVMDGTVQETIRTEDPAQRKARLNKNLSLGKTKKQLKYEQKQEDIKNGVGTGYSLLDDERFKDLFNNKG